MKKSLLALMFLASVQFAFALDAPVAQLHVSGGVYTLTWSEVPEADGYAIYSMTDPYDTGTLLAEVEAGVLSYDVSGGDPFFYVTTLVYDPPPAPGPSGHAEYDVISVFSDAFTDLPGTDFNPWWWQSTVVTIVDLEGNPTLKYEIFNYQGTQLADAEDLQLMEYLHLDLWTEDEPAVNVFLISETTGEQPYAMSPAMGVWNSYDIPLSHFTGLGLAIDDIHQLKFDGGTSGTIYLDNIYFWKDPYAAGADPTLSDLQVDAVTVDGFVYTDLGYHVELPFGTVIVPTVTATTTDPNATHLVNDAPGLPGTTEVVVTSDDESASLTYSIDFTVAEAVPGVPAPTPTAHPDSVLSIYSDAYVNLPETNFNPFWGQNTIVTVDYDVAGDNTLLYESLNYQGTNLGHVEGADQDVSGYGYFHVDFWTPNATALNFFLISRTSGERSYALPITLEDWNSVDIPLSYFTDLGLALTDIYQFKVDGGDGVSTMVYFDNWYFHGVGEVVEDPEPTVPAPTPTYDPGDVISLFSDVYTDHPVDTWSAEWDQANVSDYDIGGDAVKLYENLVFAGIEFTTTTVDASTMTHFRLDFWTPDATDLPAVFKIKLVDFGADGAWGGGDDVEHELWIDASYAIPLESENWVVFDLPFTEFPGLTTRGHLAQLIISGDPNTVYIDNVLFHMEEEEPTVPDVPAPTPTAHPDSVLSIYSDAYTNLTDTNFNPAWGQNTIVTVDYDVAGDNTLLYEYLNYQGTNLGHFDGADQDVSGYGYIHLDFWTHNATALNFFLISRTTGERSYALPITLGDWVSLDIPLSYFTDLGQGLTDIFQFKVDGGDGITTTVYFDNWYFHGIGEVVEDPEPDVPAPTPTAHPDSVLSIYSGAYTNLADTNFNPNWGQSTVVTVDFDVAGDNTLLYENLNYQGTNLGHADGADQDVSGYGYLHVDFWTPDATILNFFLISRTTGERSYALPITQEDWVSVDIPLSYFSDLGLALTNIFQFKVDTLPDGVAAKVYFDNWYFHGVGEVPEEPEPTVPAPTPTYDPGNVISLFSDVYTDHPVDTWSAPWDQAEVSDYDIGGDAVKLYQGLVFAGIEFTTTTVDASAMTHFRLDFWTPDNTDLPAVFKIKLVDFGADGAWGGGDDVEHELWIDASYSIPLQSENWVVFDLPLTEFPGLTTTGHVAQLIISGDPNTVYIDNVLFHN